MFNGPADQVEAEKLLFDDESADQTNGDAQGAQAAQTDNEEAESDHEKEQTDAEQAESDHEHEKEQSDDEEAQTDDQDAESAADDDAMDDAEDGKPKKLTPKDQKRLEKLKKYYRKKPAKALGFREQPDAEEAKGRVRKWMPMLLKGDKITKANELTPMEQAQTAAAALGVKDADFDAIQEEGEKDKSYDDFIELTDRLRNKYNEGQELDEAEKLERYAEALDLQKGWTKHDLNYNKKDCDDGLDYAKGDDGWPDDPKVQQRVTECKTP